MRLILLSGLCFGAFTSIAYADVIEFKANGEVIKHIVSDYRHKTSVSNISYTPKLTAKHKNKYSDYINNASKKYGVDSDLIRAMIFVESRFNAKAVSPKGARGLMQLMPATAKELGVSDSFDPASNIDGGTRYISQMLKQNNGDISLALAAYNAGQGAVNKYGAIPPFKETQNYVKQIKILIGGST